MADLPTVEDVAPNGYAIDRAMVRQKKTGRQVKFELTDQTRQAVDDYLRASGKKSGEFLFTSRRRTDSCMTTRQYARLVAEMDWRHWAGSEAVRDAFVEKDEGDPDLPAHGKSSGRSAPARPHENREHRALSRYRGRRPRSR